MMRNEGTINVNGIIFSWSITDGDGPMVTVHHGHYGSKSKQTRLPPAIAARLLAKELLAKAAASPL